MTKGILVDELCHVLRVFGRLKLWAIPFDFGEEVNNDHVDPRNFM